MLHFRKTGEGSPVIVLHGLFGSLENLASLARAMSENHCVYSVDLPNHGRSAHVSQTSLQSMAYQLIEWMMQEKIPSAGWVGHSLGGKVAMEVALIRPDLVERLVVLDIAPVAYAPAHNEIFAGLRSLPLANLNSRTDADALLAEYVTEPGVRSFLLKNLVKVDSGFAWRMNLEELWRNYSQLLAANSQSVYAGPVLLIKGEKSDYLKPEYRTEVASRFPAASLKIVSGAGHWLHVDKSGLVNGIVSRFIGGDP